MDHGCRRVKKVTSYASRCAWFFSLYSDYRVAQNVKQLCSIVHSFQTAKSLKTVAATKTAKQESAKPAAYLEDWNQCGRTGIYQHHTQSETAWVVCDVHNVIRCRIVAINSSTKEKARSRSPQVSKTNNGYLVEKQSVTRGSGHRHNGEHKSRHKREKTEMAQARSVNGRQQTAKTCCTLEYKRYKEKAWKTTKELDRHHTTRLKSIGMTREVAQKLAVNREG